jgi:hypothetical protein
MGICFMTQLLTRFRDIHFKPYTEEEFVKSNPIYLSNNILSWVSLSDILKDETSLLNKVLPLSISSSQTQMAGITCAWLLSYRA